MKETNILHSCCAPIRRTGFLPFEQICEVGRPNSASREKQPQYCRFRNEMERNKQRYKLKLLFAQTTSTHLKKSLRRSLSFHIANSQIVRGREAKGRQADDQIVVCFLKINVEKAHEEIGSRHLKKQRWTNPTKQKLENQQNHLNLTELDGFAWQKVRLKKQNGERLWNLRDSCEFQKLSGWPKR